MLYMSFAVFDDEDAFLFARQRESVPSHRFNWCSFLLRSVDTESRQIVQNIDFIRSINHTAHQNFTQTHKSVIENEQTIKR